MFALYIARLLFSHFIIDEQRNVETDADKLRNDLLDLVESMKGRKVIQGVERSVDNPNISFAIIHHGEFIVIIPADETVEAPADFRDRLPGDVMHCLVTKRLGAEGSLKQKMTAKCNMLLTWPVGLQQGKKAASVFHPPVIIPSKFRRFILGSKANHGAVNHSGGP